jgi:hypothetical protein
VKPIAAIILTSTLVLHSESWELAGEEHNTKYFLNPEIQLVSLGGEKGVKIQSKIVFPSGLFVITIRYWRPRNKGWEAATKTIDAFEANGRPQSHQEWDDSKVVWTATDPPKSKVWVLLLDKAVAILQATKQGSD